MSDERKWADVPGWPGYRVSDDGELQSCRNNVGVLTSQWKTLTGTVDADGYIRVELSYLRRKVGIHLNTLVLICHGDRRPPGKSMALHNNGNRVDNRITNLRWGFDQDNANDRAVHGTDVFGERNGRAKLTWEMVREIRRKRCSENTSAVALSREYGIGRDQVHRIIGRLSWKHDPEEVDELSC